MHDSGVLFRHPWPFIIVPCILTAVLSFGILLNFKIVRGVYYLYSPLDARWKVEEAVFGENWASDDDHFYPGDYLHCFWKFVDLFPFNFSYSSYFSVF